MIRFELVSVFVRLSVLFFIFNCLSACIKMKFVALLRIKSIITTPS